MGRWFLALLSAATLLLGNGCSVNGGSPSSSQDPVQKHAISGGSNLSLRVNKAAFSANQEIEVNVDITNSSSQPIEYFTVNSCDDGVNIYIKAQDSAQQLVQKRKGGGRVCAEVVRHLQLQPGAKITKNVIFTAAPANKTEPLHSGTYLVHVELRTDHAAEPISVEAPIKIVVD